MGKRIHQLNEVSGYSYNDAIIIDKNTESESKMMKLGKLIDIVISYQTIGEPILLDIDVPNVMSIDSIEHIQPIVSGSNLRFDLINAPTFMSIDNQSGLITVEPDTTGIFPNIELVISNIYGSHRETFSIKINKRLPKSNKIVEYLTPIKNNRRRTNNEFFMLDMKNRNNQIALTSPFGQPRLLKNSINVFTGYYDGIDDSLIANTLLKDKLTQSILISFRPEIDINSSDVYYPIIGDHLNGNQVAVLLNNDNTLGLSFDGRSSNKARYSFNGNSLSDFLENENNGVCVNNEWNYLYVEYETPFITENFNISTTYPSFSHGTHGFKGYIGGILTFNDKLNTEEITNFTNYLKSKYKS